MKTDFLLIGQGVSGTWLSYFLEKYSIDHVVIDNGYSGSASRLAGGLINPVTGRNKVKTWLADELLPFCKEQYQSIGAVLNETVIEEKQIIECFTNHEAIELFKRRIGENPQFLHLLANESAFKGYFKNVSGFGCIDPAYLVRVELLLHAWRNRLAKRNQLVETEFDSKKLLVTDQGFNYEDIELKKIIYCDGIGLQNHSIPHVVPLAPTKGEALIVKIPGLPTDTIFKNKLTLLPMKQIDHWWVGSSVEWEFENERPTENFKAQSLQALENWLDLPIELIEQRAAIRMGTMERRPLVGMQGPDKKVGYLNGMGTKGCSLAPYFAQQLVRNILWDEPIHSEANWARFA